MYVPIVYIISRQIPLKIAIKLNDNFFLICFQIDGRISQAKYATAEYSIINKALA